VGYGTVIAGIYLVGILFVSFYAFADSVNRMSTTSWQSVEEALKVKMQKLDSALYVTNITVSSDRTRVYANLTNTGDVTIARSQFADMDVLITYTNNATGVTQTYWCYYNSSDTDRDRWTLNSTITPNPSPSIVNPLDWDPSKTLAITIQLAEGNQMKDHSIGYLKIILPEGSSNGRDFVIG
jgi:archaellum component FlaF (FlaF/FlaG flagellin family)